MATRDYGEPLAADTEASKPQEQAAQVAGTAKAEGQRVASTAAEEGQHVAAVAKGEAKQVAGEAKQQAMGLLDEARAQVEDQSRVQRDRLVTTLRSFTDDLDKMQAGEGAGSGMAADLVGQVSDGARALVDRIDGREPAALLDELRSFARRRPGAFLLGALAAGVVVGRVTRGARDAGSQDDAITVSAYDAPGPTPPVSTTGLGTYPVADPYEPVVPPAEPAVGTFADPLPTPVNDPVADPLVDPTVGRPGEGRTGL